MRKLLILDLAAMDRVLGDNLDAGLALYIWEDPTICLFNLKEKFDPP